jgi:hypothetical protein
MTKTRTQTIKITVKLTEGHLRLYHLPKECAGKRYSVNFTKDTIEIFPNPDGGQMCRETGLNTKHIVLHFGKRKLPFVPFEAKRVKCDAIYDGTTIIFDAPLFLPVDAPVKRKVATNSLDDFRFAIDEVNKYVRQYNGTVSVKDNQISVTIQKEV